MEYQEPGAVTQRDFRFIISAFSELGGLGLGNFLSQARGMHSSCWLSATEAELCSYTEERFLGDISYMKISLGTKPACGLPQFELKDFAVEGLL